MKIKTYVSILIILLVISAGKIRAQDYFINVEASPDMPDDILQTLLLAENFSSVPPLAHFSLSPIGAKVVLDFYVEWQKNPSEGFRHIYSSRTLPFIIDKPAYFISDINVLLNIDKATETTNDDVIEENRRIGKPSGIYRVTVKLLDENLVERAADVEEISFLNPSQTLTIVLPVEGSEQFDGGVIASWTELAGISEYKITAGKFNGGESPEEALASGTPYIDDVSVGSKTLVNLRTYLEREWMAGDNIAFQVKAVVPGSPDIESGIVTFSLKNKIQDKGNISENLIGLIGLLENVDEKLEDILSGNLEILGSMVDGKMVSKEEVEEILNYLKKNPSKIVRIEAVEE